MKRLTIDIDDETLQAIERVGTTQSLNGEQAAAYLLDRTLFGISRRMNVPVEDYKPQSIMVMTDDNGTDLRHYRCQNCGNIVFDYCGDTKLTMGGQYDRDNMMIEGQAPDPDPFGRPTLITCQGRVIVQYPNGRTGKVRCGYKYYKMKV